MAWTVSTVRIGGEHVRRAAAVAAAMQQSLAGLQTIRVTRSDAIREALDIGLATLERQYRVLAATVAEPQ